jgi:hypothetical protein
VVPILKTAFNCLIGSFLKPNQFSMCRNDTRNRELISQWLILSVPALILRQHHKTNKKGRSTLAVDPALHLPMKTALFSRGINFNSNRMPDGKTYHKALKKAFFNAYQV